VDGEIVVRGPNVMRGYWKESAPSVVDGWFATGDLGHLDADGYLSVVDRKKDLIIRGGYNVYPRDIEDVLLTHPAVAAAAVVGRPDDRLGEEVVAFVALRTPATVAELVAYAKENLAATKYPRDIRIVDAIPLTSVGKVDRKKVRTMTAGN
jgi:long-chain acyl-CoA synthetase